MIELAFLFVGVVFAALLYIHWSSEYSAIAKTINLIPGPPKIPIIGFSMEGTELLLKQKQDINAYGHIYRIWIFSEPLLFVSSAKMAEVVLTNKVNINKGFYEMFEPWLGNGILVSEGMKWKHTRRLLTPAFHFKILDTFFDVFNRNSTVLTEIMAKKIEESNAGELNMISLMKRCTLDIICEAAMGVDVNAQLDPDSSYIQSIARVNETIITRTYSTSKLLPDWLYMIASSEGRQFRNDVSNLHKFTKTVIQQKKREIAEEDVTSEDVNDNSTIGIKKKRAFLDLLLLAAREGADLSDSNIQNEVDTFMFAGHDTTSITVSMFLYCMATHPQYQKLLQEELDEVFGDSDRECTTNDASKMKYLECCIKESMRLYTTVPNIARKISEEVEINGYKVPAGTSVCIQMFYLHRNPEYFPDPLTYNPERFRPENCIGRHPFAFIPFSAGPRNCIGQKFAMLEAKVIISALLRKFNFSYNLDRKPLNISADLVLNFPDGVPLMVSHRN